MARTLLSTSSLFSSTSSGTTAVLPSWSIAGGSLVVVAIRAESADATVSVTDDKGGVWTAIRVRNTLNLWIAYAWAHPGGSTVVTATFSAAQTYRKMQGIELSGSDSVDPYLPGSKVETTGNTLSLNHSVSFSGVASVVSAQGDYSASTYGVTSGTKFTSTDGFICGSYTLSTTSPIVHTHTGANAATCNLSVAFADPVVGDATVPTFSGSITIDAKTSSTIALTLPTATDNVAVTGYEYRVDGGSWVDNGASTAVSLSGLTALTSYTIDARAYDAAANKSTTLSVTTSTYRAGASAGSIVTATAPQDGNPAGFLYALAQTLPTSDWVSYTITSGPTPSGGTLDAQANGAFSYTGPDAATMVVQPEINGTPTAETITVTLYDQSGGGGGSTGKRTPTGMISFWNR